MGNGSGARENALCEWIGRIQLERRRQRNFVFESCNGVAREGRTLQNANWEALITYMQS